MKEEQKSKIKYIRVSIGFLSSIVSLFGVWYFLFHFFGATDISAAFASGFCVLLEVSVILCIIELKAKWLFLLAYVPIVILKLFININSLDKLNLKEYEKANAKQIKIIHEQLRAAATTEIAKLEKQYLNDKKELKADIRYNSAQAARGVEYMEGLTAKRENQLEARKAEYLKDKNAIKKTLEEKLKEPLSNNENFFIATGTPNETGKRIISWGGAALLEGLIFWAFFSGFKKSSTDTKSQIDCTKCQKLSELELKMSELAKDNGHLTFSDISSRELTKILRHAYFVSAGFDRSKVSSIDRDQFDITKKIFQDIEKKQEIKNAGK